MKSKKRVYVTYRTITGVIQTITTDTVLDLKREETKDKLLVRRMIVSHETIVVFHCADLESFKSCCPK